MKDIFSVPVLASLLLSGFFTSCEQKPKPLFRLLSPEQTGITFTNRIEESDTFNILTVEYIYNGGGVGIADFNNDGLKDVFFAGNLVPNTLYLNKGGFKFEDVSKVAGVNEPGRWNSGIAVVDINNDGWPDIYVTATMKPDANDRRNMLFVNNGLNKDGIPTFSNKAADYGIEDGGYSVTAAFLDYDRDGDLDLYILTNERLTNVPTNYRPKITDGSSPNNDRLYRNNGNGTFTNVTKEAGITIEGFGLGLAVADFNKDGWPDIYVSNDYLSNDLMYLNNKEGTFTNRIAEFIGHQSQFSMGNDVADINNDGLPDIITTDMLPETNFRRKTTIGNKSYLTYINNEQFGYEHQYVRNMLHLNNGLDQGISFSEIGQLAGVHQTEWSWSPLFVDVDNDGNKDLIVTNGFPKDVTDKDFANYRADVGNVASAGYLVDSIPVVKIPNYAFRNNGNLIFSDFTKQWGLMLPSFSNGAAFADLDNDGDQDYITNNINDQAFVFENTLYTSSPRDPSTNNFLSIQLQGSTNNRQGLGTKVSLHYENKIQYQECSVYRGFLSSVDNTIHFGAGTATSIDSIIIEWPDGKMQLIKEAKTNQRLTISYSNEDRPAVAPIAIGASADKQAKGAVEAKDPLFVKLGSALGLAYRHEEADFIDFNLQRTLPHKFSQAGPGLAVGDINGDGLEDLIAGGSTGHHFSVFIQKSDGSFSQSQKRTKDESKKEEDEGLLLFDADSDGDLDLYVVSGSIESMVPENYHDRLFINDGKGTFRLDPTALPEITASGSCARAADFDADGDLDLFVGGRVVPGSYPLPAESYLLKNEKGKFTDVTAEVCPLLNTLGMVTDALWSDFDQDGKTDLVVAGEFMPITMFQNNGSELIKLNTTGLEGYVGWWNSLAAGDFDKDGDTDYVAGNLGWNNNFQVTPPFPLKVYAKDFDGNGSVDPILACYMRESMDADLKKLYPVHFWDEMNSQSPKFRRKFSRYWQFGKATMETLLTPDELLGAQILEANHMGTSYIENLGGGKFRLKALPVQAQIAPVNGILTDDVNNDGNLDVVMVGNDYGNEVFAGRYDAFTGLVLLGEGDGNFRVSPSAMSGFVVDGDAKAIVRLSSVQGDLYIASQTRDSLKVFASGKNRVGSIFRPGALDTWAMLTTNDGRQQRIEFYHGSGYLSQSTRLVRLGDAAADLTIYDSRGNSRKPEQDGK